MLQEEIQSLLTKARLDEISRSAPSTALLAKIVNNKTNYDNYDYNVIEEVEFEEDEPQTSHDNNVSESNNIAVYYNNFM